MGSAFTASALGSRANPASPVVRQTLLQERMADMEAEAQELEQSAKASERNPVVDDFFDLNKGPLAIVKLQLGWTASLRVDIKWYNYG